MKKIIILLSLFFYFLFWVYTANAWYLWNWKLNFFEINWVKYYKGDHILKFDNDEIVTKWSFYSTFLQYDFYKKQFYFYQPNWLYFYPLDSETLKTSYISHSNRCWYSWTYLLLNWEVKCYSQNLDVNYWLFWSSSKTFSYIQGSSFQKSQLYFYMSWNSFEINKKWQKEAWFFLAYKNEYDDIVYRKVRFYNYDEIFIHQTYIYNYDEESYIFAIKVKDLSDEKYKAKLYMYNLSTEELRELESIELTEEKAKGSVFAIYNFSWYYTIKAWAETIKRWIIKKANESTEAERSISDFIPEIKERLGILKERLEEVWQYSDEAKEFYNSINSLLMRPWLTFSIFNEKGLIFANNVKNEKLKEIFKYFINYFNPEKKKSTLESLKLINIPLNLNWKSFTDLDNAFFIFKKNVEIPRAPEIDRENKNNEKLWEVKKKLDSEKIKIENDLKKIDETINKKNIEEKEKYLSKYVDNYLDLKEVNTSDPRKLTTNTSWRCEMFYKWAFKYSLAQKSQLFFFEVPKSNVEYFNHDVLEFVNVIVNTFVFSWVNPIIQKIPLMWDVNLKLDVSMWVNINYIINFFINIINSFLLYILDALNWMVSFLWNFQTLDEWYYCFFGKVEKLKYQEYLAFDWKNSVWVFKALPDWWFVKWEQNVLDYLFLFLFSWFFFYFAFLIFNKK